MQRLALIAALSLVATTSFAGGSLSPAPSDRGGGAGSTLAAPTGAMDCSTPKKTIESQLAAIKAGASADVVKQCFTARQKDRITAEMLAAAKTQLGSMTLDELYASEEASGDSVKVKMKNGRTLTTLLKDGSTWKADTLWFK